MKILHIVTGLGDGGAEHTLFKLCKYENKNEHIVVSLSKGGKYFKLLKSINVQVYSLNFNYFNFLNQFLILRKIIFFLKPDIVQTWLIHGDLIGGFAAKSSSQNSIVWNIRYSNFTRIETKPITIFILKVLSKLSNYIPDRIIIVSRKAKGFYQTLGYPKKKIRVIQNGYDLSILKNNKNKKNYKNPKEKIIIGNIARFHPKKDHINFLKALGHLKSKNINFQALLAGAKINRKNKVLCNLIQKLNLSKNIKLLGVQKNISKLMSRFDVYVQSSKFGEGFPNVVAEAMACRCPCIVTDVGDASLIVKNNGIIVPPGDAEKLANGIRSLILKKETNKWTSIINQSRLIIKKNFSISRMINAYQDVWQKVFYKKKKILNNNKKIDILYVIPETAGGGAELIVRKLNTALNKREFNVKTIYFHNPLKIKLKFNEHSLDLIGPRDIRAIWYLRKFIKKYYRNRDLIIHGHLTWPLYYLVFATFGMKVKLIYTEHNTFNRRRKYLVLKPLERYIYGKYAYIINVSRGVKDSLNKWIGSPNLNKKNKIIYNGSRLFKIERKEKINFKKIKLVSIGSLTEQKGFDIALQAIALIKDIVDSYTIVGEGKDLKKLEILATKLKIRDKIFFKGYQKNIKPFLLKADMGLLPSRWEGFGLVAVEILSSGLPIVSSDVYGNNEVVEKCIAVKSVKPNNVVKLAEAIKDHLKYIKKIGIERIRINAKQQANKFTYKNMLNGYTNIYKDIQKQLILNKMWYANKKPLKHLEYINDFIN